MVGAHRFVAGVVGGLVGGDQDVHVTARVGVEVVPLLGALPAVREVLGGGVDAVGDLGGALEDAGRVGGHVGAAVDQLVPPGELLLDAHVEGVVDGDDAAAALDVAAHRLALLLGLPDHAGVLEHGDGVEPGEVLGVEDGRVLALYDLEAVLLGLLLEHGDAGRDGVVDVADGAGEEQDAEVGLVGFGGRGGGGGQGGQRQEQGAAEGDGRSP